MWLLLCLIYDESNSELIHGNHNLSNITVKFRINKFSVEHQPKWGWCSNTPLARIPYKPIFSCFRIICWLSHNMISTTMKMLSFVEFIRFSQRYRTLVLVKALDFEHRIEANKWQILLVNDSLNLKIFVSQTSSLRFGMKETENNTSESKNYLSQANQWKKRKENLYSSRKYLLKCEIACDIFKAGSYLTVYYLFEILSEWLIDWDKIGGDFVKNLFS